MISDWAPQWDYVLAGVGVTLLLAVIALCLGLVLGMLAAWGESARCRAVAGVTKTITLIVRGVPELLVIFAVYFGLNHLIRIYFPSIGEVSGLFAGALALALLFGAYACGVFKAAFAAIEPGQQQAALLLGYSKKQLFFAILLPQAWRYALPGLGNLWLVLLKDTALVSLLGIADLMTRAQTAAASEAAYFTYFALAAIVYWLLTALSTALLAILQRYVNRGYTVDGGKP